MPNQNTLVDLCQALLFLHCGREPIQQADFKALGPIQLPDEDAPYHTLINAARRGVLPLSGKLSCTANHGCPVNTRVCSSHGRFVSAFEARMDCYDLRENFTVPRDQIVRGQIDFETASIRLSSAPSEVRAREIAQLNGNHDALTYYVDCVVIDGEALRSLRPKSARLPDAEQATQARRKPGPPESDRAQLVGHLAVIIHHQGIPESTNELIRRLQERLGDECPGETTLKKFLKHVVPMLQSEP